MSNVPNRLVTSYVDSTDSERCGNARREALSLLAHYALRMENYEGSGACLWYRFEITQFVINSGGFQS